MFWFLLFQMQHLAYSIIESFACAYLYNYISAQAAHAAPHGCAICQAERIQRAFMFAVWSGPFGEYLKPGVWRLLLTCFLMC